MKTPREVADHLACHLTSIRAEIDCPGLDGGSHNGTCRAFSRDIERVLVQRDAEWRAQPPGGTPDVLVEALENLLDDNSVKNRGAALAALAAHRAQPPAPVSAHVAALTRMRDDYGDLWGTRTLKDGVRYFECGWCGETTDDGNFLAIEHHALCPVSIAAQALAAQPPALTGGDALATLIAALEEFERCAGPMCTNPDDRSKPLFTCGHLHCIALRGLFAHRASPVGEPPRDDGQVCGHGLTGGAYCALPKWHHEPEVTGEPSGGGPKLLKVRARGWVEEFYRRADEENAPTPVPASPPTPETKCATCGHWRNAHRHETVDGQVVVTGCLHHDGCACTAFVSAPVPASVTPPTLLDDIKKGRAQLARAGYVVDSTAGAITPPAVAKAMAHSEAQASPPPGELLDELRANLQAAGEVVEELRKARAVTPEMLRTPLAGAVPGEPRGGTK